ncbi:MAG: hypothetical protein JNN08_29260 [Bryobacterales bacterium]|nr:hypothetical protein [Bryobacterales bacterium]
MKFLVLFAAAASAFAAVGGPRVGCLVHPDGSLRQVLGVRGNFIVSSPLAADVLSFSCDGDFLFAKTSTTLLAFNRTGAEVARQDTVPGKAAFVGLSVILEDDTALVFNEKDQTWRPAAERPAVPPRDGKILLDEVKAVPIPGDIERIERMSARWLHVITTEGHFAVDTGRDDPELFALPVGARQ